MKKDTKIRAYAERIHKKGYKEGVAYVRNNMTFKEGLDTMDKRNPFRKQSKEWYCWRAGFILGNNVEYKKQQEKREMELTIDTLKRVKQRKTKTFPKGSVFEGMANHSVKYQEKEIKRLLETLKKFVDEEMKTYECST